MGRKKYAGEVHLFYLDTENEIVRVLDRARVLIDLGTPPDLYAQIAAISAGVPQIVLNAEQLVEHEKNGLVLQGDINNLTKAIKYYTQELKYWNEAMMYAVAKISELTGGNLAKRWQTWLEQSE
ncbi:accessory Sec system glycosyltransferase Asp1 [Ligilactobacillus murinus]|uniref:accessory Sec system glycosyltransferase Asp1 n=1 Tax=Ligilactobacillus murinus TaxID=1622 RepID=UPI0022856D27|nr:accessory Sec system glycosyltransferase Asp1 [Ligilactobacillus murinus]MCZ0705429.1 accessory Sec system glycosyltransferase Asp1 [Ligilactobacillus murinus]